MSTPLLIILITLLLILVILSSFFSAAETAYTSVNISKIEVDVQKGKKSAKLIKKHYKKFGWTLSTILICNNLVNISASASMTFLFTKLLGASGLVTIISTFIMTPIIVIFGEIFPKIIAKKHSYSYLKKIVYIMEILNLILWPITYPISKITLSSKITNSEKELKSLIKLAKREGVLEGDEAELVSKALDLDSTKVNEIMTKKEKIVSINHNSKVEDAFILYKKHGFSRLLVSDDNGKYIGVLILKDIFMLPKSTNIQKYVVELFSISKNILVTKALEEMRIQKSHIVLVTENKTSGDVVGILSLEDIIEELVGEIYDEHDKEKKIREIAHFKWKVNGDSKLIDLEKEIKFSIESDDKNMTVKQFVQSRINRKIKKNLKYTYKKKIVFKVISNKNGEETIFKIIKK